MEAETFWSHVKSAMKSQDLTQEQLTAKCGLNLPTFRGWIARSIIPDVISAYKIATVLGTTVEALVMGESPDDPYRAKYENLYRRLKDLIEEP